MSDHPKINSTKQSILHMSWSSVKKMTDCQGEGAKSPMEIYENLTDQGEKVRSLKTANAEKVSVCKPIK